MRGDPAQPPRHLQALLELAEGKASTELVERITMPNPRYLEKSDRAAERLAWFASCSPWKAKPEPFDPTPGSAPRVGARVRSRNLEPKSNVDFRNSKTTYLCFLAQHDVWFGPGLMSAACAAGPVDSTAAAPSPRRGRSGGSDRFWQPLPVPASTRRRDVLFPALATTREPIAPECTCPCLRADLKVVLPRLAAPRERVDPDLPRRPDRVSVSV